MNGSSNRWLARVFSVLMLSLFVAVVGAVPAGADPTPSTHWAPVSLSQIPRANNIATDAGGNVSVGCGDTYDVLFKTFSAGTGALAQDVGFSSGDSGSFCTGNSTVGADGTVYVEVAPASGARRIQAWKNDQRVWEYQLACGPYASTWTMTVGADGNLYAIIYQGSGSCSSTQLIGLSAAVSPGTNPPVPQVVMNQPVSGFVPGQGLAAYGDGLVLYLGTSIKYVPYTGTSSSSVSLTNASSTQVGLLDHWFEAAPNGQVFVANKASSAEASGCSSPGNVSKSVSAVRSTGIAWESAIFDTCAVVRETHPTPNGGVAVRYSYAPNGQPTEKVVVFDDEGALVWSKLFPGIEYPSSMVVGVDLGGKVVIRRNLADWKTVGGSTYRFPEINFTILDSSGVHLSSFVLRGESSTTSGPSYMWTNGGSLTMAQDALYVVAYQCSTYSNCDTSTTKLYPFRVRGLEMDYPRGALFGQAPRTFTELKYVALGDSFSSGEGVPPFEAGTDTSSNKCHRSEVAYSHLLGDEPAINADFVASLACSGAETKHIIDTVQYTQAAQSTFLNTGVDVVTVTIGGNDIGFGPLVKACVEDNSPGPQCDDSDEYANTMAKLENDLPDALDDAYEAIVNELDSGARVLVVGYPEMIPDPAINTWPQCAYLEHDEKVAARAVIDGLNEAVQDAVVRAGSQFEYVDPNGSGSPFAGHELCLAGGYYNGIDLTHQEYSLHPTAEGQRAYAEVVRDYLVANP